MEDLKKSQLPASARHEQVPEEKRKEGAREVIPLPIQWNNPGLMEGETRVQGVVRLDSLDKEIRRLREEVSIIEGGLNAASEFRGKEAIKEKANRKFLNLAKRVVGRTDLRPAPEAIEEFDDETRRHRRRIR